jgi:hypothetical protein
MSAMVAFRILLMLVLCLVTDAPAPVTPYMLEHVEDGEEVQLAQRLGLARRHRLVRQSAPRPDPSLARVAARSAPAPRREARPAAAPARKVPSPVPDSAPASEDH